MSRKKAPVPPFDPVLFGREMSGIVRDYVSRQTLPLEQRIAELERILGVEAKPTKGSTSRRKR